MTSLGVGVGWRVLFGGGGGVEIAVWGSGWDGECCLVRYLHTSICVLPVFGGEFLVVGLPPQLLA